MKKCMKDMLQEAEYEWQRHKNNYLSSRRTPHSASVRYRTSPYPTAGERYNNASLYRAPTNGERVSPLGSAPSVSGNSPTDFERVWVKPGRSSSTSSGSSTSSKSSPGTRFPFSFDHMTARKSPPTKSGDYSPKNCSCCHKS